MESEKHCCGLRRRVLGWFCVVSVAILIAIVAFLIVVLIYKPRELEISVSDASLSPLAPVAATENNTLAYGLALALTLRNPNRKGGVLFDRVQVTASYEAKTFSAVNLTSSTPFYQGRKNTTVLRAVLRGRHAALTGPGAHVMDVKLAVRVRVRQSGVLTRYFEPPEIGCDNLRVPLLSESNANSSDHFRATKCKNVFIFKTRDVNKKHVDSEHY